MIITKYRSKKELKRLKLKKAFDAAARVKYLVKELPHQAALNAFLMQEPDVDRRMQLYEYVKEFIQFPNPQFPTSLETHSRIVVPDFKKSLIS